MASYLDLDLHGLRPEDDEVGRKLLDGARQARRMHVGLRVIHGRGQHVLADIVQGWLRRNELPFQEGVLNPGETRVEALDLQRARSL